MPITRGGGDLIVQKQHVFVFHFTDTTQCGLNVDKNVE